MVQYNKNIKNKKKGFTLVELMVVLAITAILAVLVGGGLIAYTRLARFEKNEANARTLFQTAQISLTRMETAGELDAFRRQVMEEGSTGDHFQNDVTVTDADGKTLVSRTKTELDQNVAALYYDRTGAAAGNHNALVKELLGDYIYDASLLNASICVEIDVQSGQVYSVFYDTKSDKLRFNQDGATNIYDRSYDHRRNDSLVGYYSAEDRVNVVQLVQTKLKVKNPRLTNGETLTLSWSGNSSLGDLDTSYTATAYAAGDTGDNRKPLFTITIKRDTAGAADDNKQVITEMPVVIYQYNDEGQQTGTEEKKLYFPLSYNKGSFVLTLDAMADAALLRACENDEVAATSLYSITRLLNDPKDIYIAMRAEPRENYSDTYTASKEETTNEENTLLAKGGTAVTADLKYFRHLYNLRWSADWKIDDKGTYTLTPQASNSTGLNWTGGGVTVYCASGERYPAAKVPSLNDPVAWPTIPELGEKIELTSKTTVLATKTTRVPILNLQLSSKSVAKTGRAGKDELADHYVGLIGENKGKISYITLRDPDIQVNVKTETVDAGALPKADQLKLTATKFVTALAKDDENWRDVRAVGALCGVNTGTLENCALTRGTNSSTSALVAAALAFDNTTTATQRIEQTPDAGSNSYTYYTDEPRGIGGLVGVAIPKAESVMQDLTVASDVTVAGLLVDKNTKNVETTTAADQQAEKARYAAAAAEPNDENSLWRSVGVGGVFGTVDAAQMKTDSKTNIVNNGFVTGNGFTGGIVGNLFTMDTSVSQSLTGLRNNGTVSAGANYKGDTAGDARSLVLGQFFGGIAGYGRGVTLQGCESVTRSDLTETQLKEQVKAGFDETGTLTDASPLKGDFVGGLVGYGKDIVLEDCKTGKGYVLGSRFVGGLAGGFTGSGVKQNDTNSSDVFGSRYVGGIVSVNGSNSIINGMTNTGLVAAFGKNAAYVGGIVGVNDAGWGGSEDKTAKATVQNCANRMSGDNATDTRRINLLKELSGCADYVGGIAGCNGKNGVVTWDKSGTPTLGAILYGNNYVGGVAGYNDEKAIISNTFGQDLTISGQIVAAGKAVGGMIGLNCASTLPSATVKVSRVAGQQLVGGVIGANLPVDNFTMPDGGTFNTDVASGRVEADAVAGGIIGYNRLLAAKPAGVTLEALLPTIDKSTGVLTDSTDANTSDGEVILTGFWNKLNLQADIYVGGIVGANDANTKLTIQKATNGATQNALSVGGLNPSNNGAFKGGVSLNALAGGRYDFDDVRGALAGGIIGYATPNTVLENCINYGTVAHKCAAGGFAGWNEGTINGGSMAASLGNREAGYTYLGGVAGVNGGRIQSAYPAEDCAVRGDSYVGGIAGVNLGGDATASKGLIICTGNNSSTGTVEANQYAGGVAGANVGSISLSGQMQSSVTATDYAGGVAGINTKNGIYTGRIYGAENTTGAVRGSVTAANYAGGVAGTNRAEITRVENYASVRASTQYAGGIAGENDAGGTISYCSHAQNPIYATNGEAGGIAGNNNKDALIENVQVVRAAVTAANGTAGGVTATNFGIIGQDSGLENNSSVSGCTITGTSESIGAVAAYNGKDATIRNVRLAANANVQFSTPAVTIGGLAGMNDGAVTGCQVENGALALNDGLRAGTNTVTLGGAVGRTTKNGTVSSTNVLLNLTQNLDKYTNLGGVAGKNDGTLKQCTYSGTMGGEAGEDGLVSVGARSTGSTVGGIAGLNNSTITGCEVKYIKLQVSGISNITTTQTADEKLASASHVGGIAGRNNAEIANSYVATERSNGAGSIITARYGFVGGVAGSNNGTIKGSGSKTVQTDLMPKLKKWIADGDTNAIVAALRGNPVNGTGATVSYVSNFVDLKGVDTVTNKGYTNVYSDTGLAANDLLVGLRGSNKDMNNLASGHLGGITGFNGLNGSISSTASGKWFVYADNAARDDTTVGGIVGQNESNVTGTSALDTVVNCAAVRRFSRRTFWKTGNNATQRGDISQSDANDRDDVNYYDSTNRFNVQVGGIICNQNNRSGDRWTLTNCINFGSVYNSRSGNAGGVISLWTNYGGTLQNCYNFGDLKTNFNDGGSDCGTMGGIVAYYDAPVSNTSVNVLSCQNHGSMKSSINGWSSANDIGGIFGKVQMKNATDIMTIDLYDCVNGSTVSIQARSMAVGIFAYLGPWDGVDNPNVSSVKKGNGYNGNAQFKTIPYVTINIDRCRNFTTNMTTQTEKRDNDSTNNGKYYWIAGIVGSRSMGGYSVAPTTITNCFSVVKDDWHPVAYDKRSSTELTLKDGTVVYGEHIEGHNNYYIDSGAAFANSYKKIQGQSQTATGVTDRTLTRITTGLSTSINWGTQNSNFTERQENTKSGSRRLFIGKDKDTGGGTDDAYFAMLPTSSDGKQISYDITKLTGSTGYIGVKTGQSFGEKSTRRYIYDANGVERGQLLLVYGENAQTTKDNRKGEPDNEDITDEVIQNYYKYVLDSTKPAKPGEIDVKASQVQDADNNVYGRYEVTWGEPNDTTASPAAYYRVEILPCDDAGIVAPDADPYLKADVYQRSYTFVADKAWTGNFVVRVTPYNTNNDPNQPDNPNTSGVQTFMHALPTPEIEFRLVKRTGGGFDWNQCQTPDEKRREFKYEVVAVLKNYTEYPTDEAWTVKLTDGRYTYYFSRQNGKQYIRLTQNLERTLTLTALATPDNSSSTKYLRSAQYKSETYLPSQWRDNLHSDKDEDGLPLGTLNKDGSTEYVTYTGQTAESFEATVKFSFTPRVKNGSEHGSPTYRVMLLAKYLGNDEVNGVSLNGQYITLAARESIVTESPVTFNLNSLPSDAMTNYTDFLVVAVPVTSGKGDMKYRWDATADEVSAAIASHANDTNKEIWWKNGYEIVRTGEHSYTYAHLTPLCFSDVNRTDDKSWAIQATQTTPQIIFKQLNLNVLKAPTLAEDTDGGKVNPDNNQLTYTFKWTQEDMKATDAAPVYQIKLYGLLTDENGNVTGQEQIALKDTLTPTQNDNSFTLPVNVDTMLANGSDSWRYNKVRLEVTRVAAADTTEIGASAVADYSVKQRLPGISAPSSITRVNGETDNADALLYTVSWSPSDDARIGHYDLCVVDAGGKTVLTLPTTGNVGSLTLDLEQYQDAEMRFRVIARRKADNNTCFDGPDGALSQPETIVSRAAAPKVTASSFAPDSPNQETFLNDLKLNMTLEEAAQGNVYFTGYIFSSVGNYNTIADLARTWQNTPTGQAKYTAQQKLTQALDEMLKSRDAELVIPKDSRTVGGSASANDTTASYTFVPDGNGFTLTPDHAKQYLLPAVRVMPTDGTTASNWFYFLPDAAKAQLPAITLDAPVDAAEPERALGNAVYTQEVNLYSDPEFKSNRGTAPLELRRFTVEWTAVNKYTQADGTVRNLTDNYTFTVTPLDSKTKQPYSITVTTYDRDETDDDGTTHKRGEIKTVTKTYNDITTPLDKQTTVVDAETKETRIWYDLSVEPVTDENGNVTWKSQPYDVTGTVEKDGGTLYYKAQTVPMLELVQEDGAEPVYRITLPELQEKVQDDSLNLQKFTASVTLQTLAHSIGDDKTVASDSVKVTVNGTNTADATEDAQSMDSAESVAPAETAESTAAESAPASVPPVLMRARAALPMATPETAAAPDETDAAETAPPKRTETSDAS
ncbi:prepilin-type N-terminal cleavage/methylation domain-containing protein [Gemmiger formicilis]|uniref:prepilin-type N-terminal cleavage/methylation domain-containing protein n=1 Tax=Gemmiger formicilis TaxID=745368 RepID=UPI003521A7A1